MSQPVTCWTTPKIMSQSRDSHQPWPNQKLCILVKLTNGLFYYCISITALLLHLPSPPLDNIRVMVIFWRLRLSEQLCVRLCDTMFTVRSTLILTSSYRSNRLGLSHWDPYTVCGGGCLELYYFNLVEWFWWDSSLISTTNWFTSVLWHCWFCHLACKNRPRNDLECAEWDVLYYVNACLRSSQTLHQLCR